MGQGNPFTGPGRAASGLLSLVFLAVFLLPVAGLAPAALAADYGGHWAEEAIAEISAADIMRGYPDGKFRPDQNLTKLEAIALLLRTLGLEQQARALDNARVDYPLPPDLYWGRGYLILAVQKGMLDSRYLHQFRPGAPATRLEVAALTSLALPALKSDGAPLTYTDAEAIPSGYADYVARVTQNKLMVGLPGNRFAPNEFFTRAQMAVLLTRLLDGGWANPLPQQRLTGTIRSLEGDTLTLELRAGETVRKYLAPECGIFREGRRVALSDLQLPVRAVVVLDQNDRVSFVRHLGEGTTQTAVFKGRVESLYFSGGEYRLSIRDFEDRSITYPIHPGAQVLENGTTVDISALEKDAWVEVQVAGDRIQQVTFLPLETIQGTVTEVERDQLTVRRSSGRKVKLTVVEPVRVTRDGRAADYDDLDEDDRVTVKAFEGYALDIEIETLGSDTVEGEITDIDSTGTWHITIEDEDGDEEEYPVDEDVEVKRDGEEIDFEDLDLGEWVELELDDGEVVRIEVLEDRWYTVEGTVTDLDTGGTPEITVRRSSGSKATYDLADDVEVVKDDEELDLDEIILGSEVRLRLEGDEVVKIEILDDEDITVEGEITKVYTSTRKLTIRQSHGEKFTFRLASDAVLRDRDGRSIDLEDLEEGWEVELELEDGEITRLEVTED